MKALIYKPDSQLILVDLAKPELKANNAIVKVLGVGICGSDLLKIKTNSIKANTVLGHEMVGEIYEISDAISQKYKIKKGDRIVSSHHSPCLQCDFCLRGKESLCLQFKSSNFYPGAFCEFLELSENHLKYCLQKIPKNLTNIEASFVEPVACCIKAIENAKIYPKSKILILGLGSIGLIMGQLIKYYYPNTIVFGEDLIEDKVKLAHRLGFDNQEQDEYDYIFLCAGTNYNLNKARDGATIVIFSSSQNYTSSFSHNDIYYKELKILGSYSPNLKNLKQALKLLSKRKIQVSLLITQQASFENLSEKILECSKTGIKTYLAC